MAIGDGGQNELIATNALVSCFVHWVGCISSFGIKWDHHNPFLFVVDHCTLFVFFFVLGRFFLGHDLTHNYPTHLPTLINIVPTLVPY
jgi:hypothetical protein